MVLVETLVRLDCYGLTKRKKARQNPAVRLEAHALAGAGGAESVWSRSGTGPIQARGCS